MSPMSTSNPAAARCNFGLRPILPHSNTPSLRAAGFEDSLSDEAQALTAQVGLASEARSTPGRGRSRKDEYEAPSESNTITKPNVALV